MGSSLERERIWEFRRRKKKKEGNKARYTGSVREWNSKQMWKHKYRLIHNLETHSHSLEMSQRPKDSYKALIDSLLIMLLLRDSVQSQYIYHCTLSSPSISELPSKVHFKIKQFTLFKPLHTGWFCPYICYAMVIRLYQFYKLFKFSS